MKAKKLILNKRTIASIRGGIDPDFATEGTNAYVSESCNIYYCAGAEIMETKILYSCQIVGNCTL
jgi:hypothetical protein